MNANEDNLSQEQKPSSLHPVGSAADDAIWQKAKLEHEAAGKILDALKSVSQQERRRILAYMWDRYVLHPGAAAERSG